MLTYGDREADTVLIQMVDDHDLAVIENEVEHIGRLIGDRPFRLVAVRVKSWNDDLAPWPAPAVFGSEDFGDGAQDTLHFLTEELLPDLRGSGSPDLRASGSAGVKDTAESGPESGPDFYIGGYSLAGLFALWAVYQTDAFSGCAAASPSVWFPGFREYVKENPVKTGAVYLSLGTKEEKTRNPVMAQVGSAIREISAHLQEEGVPTVLEMNPGNHFRDPDLRTAKAFAWVLNTQASVK